MTITLYKIEKKTNSTKRATSSDPSKLYSNVVLKENTSVLNPIIIIRFDSEENIALYNYCFITEFSRYYFIDDYVYTHNGVIELHCTCDVLASFKNQIGTQWAYILRSATGYRLSLPDHKFPLSGEVFTNSTHPIANDGSPIWTSTHTPWVNNYAQGIYVIGVISKSSSPGGSLSYYAMNSSQFEQFKTLFLGDTSWAVGSFAGFEISEELWKSLFNPIQYIATCRWFPVSSIQGTASTTIDIGWWTLSNCPCVKLSTLYIDIPTIQFPLPPNEIVDSAYKNLPPFADYKLYIPPFGEFTLDGFKVGKLISNIVYGTIRAYIRIDIVSGKGALLVTYNPPDDNNSQHTSVLVWDTEQISVDVSFGQINSDVVGAIRAGANAAIEMAQGITTLNPAAIVGGAVGGLIEGTVALTPNAQFRSGGGSLAIYQSLDFRLIATYKKQVEQDYDDFGGLVYMSDRINNHSGFILTEDAHIEIFGATKTEVDRIKAYMDGGFFYE